MRVVTIEYKPIKWLHFFNSVTRLSPDRWDDISGRQLDAFESLAAKRIDGNKFLSVTLDIPVRLVKRFSDFESYNLLESFEFMRDTECYLKLSSRLQRSASIKTDELHSPLYYHIKQIEKEQKNV